MGNLKRSIALLLLAFVGFAIAVCSATAAETEVGDSRSVTIPLNLEEGRPQVEVTLVGPEGTRRTAMFLVDTGGGAFILPESLAIDIGLEWSETFRGEGREFARPDALPKALLEDFELPLLMGRVLIAIGTEQAIQGAAGLLPGHILSQHHVIFDYPGRSLTLAAPGSIQPRGEAMPMPVSQPMGFPRTVIEVDGELHGMLLDTGPPATIISQAVLEEWGKAQTDWARHDGAVGEGARLASVGGQVVETMVVEDVGWGEQTLESLTVASQQEGVFENYMSRMMTAPVVGALGSNAFMELRLELEYDQQILYVSRPSEN